MATTTYRYVGEAPEVFPDFTAAFVIADRQDDPNAADFQQAGELRPGQEFEGPAKIEHVRIERQNRAGNWVPTVKMPKTTASDDESQSDDEGSGDPPPAGDAPPTDPLPEA